MLALFFPPLSIFPFSIPYFSWFSSTFPIFVFSSLEYMFLCFFLLLFSYFSCCFFLLLCFLILCFSCCVLSSLFSFLLSISRITDLRMVCSLYSVRLTWHLHCLSSFTAFVRDVVISCFVVCDHRPCISIHNKPKTIGSKVLCCNVTKDTRLFCGWCCRLVVIASVTVSHSSPSQVPVKSHSSP